MVSQIIFDSMKKIMSIIVLSITLASSCSNDAITGPWTEEQAGRWWNNQEWPVGCCYVPTYAVNQYEIWQEGSFNPEVLDKEMALAQSIGFNVVRIYLHEDLWFADRNGFKDRINRFLEIASSHGIKVTFTFCTNGGGKEHLGVQPKPAPGIHGGGHWCQSPSSDILFDRTRWKDFKSYLQDILSSFRDDSRILYWCLYNEPENVREGRDCLEFMKEMYQWAWEVRPSQPLTSTVWLRPGSKGAKTRLDMVSFVCSNSDIITFHCYSTPDELESFIEMLSVFKKPMICQEYLARNFGSTFEDCLPIMKREKVGAINWGLAEGKCEYRFPWGHKLEDGEPEIWFHSIFWQDYSPYREEEIDFLKGINMDKSSAGRASKYTNFSL